MTTLSPECGHPLSLYRTAQPCPEVVPTGSTAPGPESRRVPTQRPPNPHAHLPASTPKHPVSCREVGRVGALDPPQWRSAQEHRSRPSLCDTGPISLCKGLPCTGGASREHGQTPSQVSQGATLWLSLRLRDTHPKCASNYRRMTQGRSPCSSWKQTQGHSCRELGGLGPKA